MKKIVMLMMVAVLMLGVSGQAMAAFNEGDLIRVVYTGTGAGTEYATDLGAFSSTTPISSTANLSGNNFSLTSVGATSWSDVRVAYFVYSSTANGGNGAAYSSGPASNGGYPSLYQFWGGFAGVSTMSLQGYQAAANGANSVTMLQSNISSYWMNANSGGNTVGQMGGFLTMQSGSAEQNLGALATAGYVDQLLYYYGADPDNSTARGTQVAVIRTFADGHTEMLPVATPIPAAVYLFGSGLVGLVGLRRKKMAA